MRQELSQLVLRAASNLDSRTLGDGTRLVKEFSGPHYLALTEVQQEVFGWFDGKKTVQQIFCEMLQKPHRPSIHGFFDLVVHAHENGFLVEASQEPGAEHVEGRRWPIRWGWRTAAVFSALAYFLGLGFMWSSEIYLALDLFECMLVLVWLIAGFSVAHILGGCLLSGFGREVHRPRLSFAYGLPAFVVDSRDSFMGGRGCEISLAVQTFAIPFLLAAIAYLWDRNSGIVAAYLMIITYSFPFGRTPLHSILRSLSGRRYQLPRLNLHFLGKRFFQRFLNWRKMVELDRYEMMFASYAIFWLAVLLHAASIVFRREADDLLANLIDPLSRMDQAAAVIVLLTIAVALLAPIVCEFIVVAENASRFLGRLKARAGLRAGVAAEKPPAKEIVGFLKDTCFLPELAPEELDRIAAAAKYVNVEPDRVILREEDGGSGLFFVYSGQVRMTLEDEAGIEHVVGHGRPGDMFGEIAAVEGGSKIVRSADKTALLVLDKTDLDALLAANSVGMQDFHQRLAIRAFLRRVEIFADWPNQALVQLAEHFAFRDVGEGEQVIQQGAENDTFYLIFNGRFEVRRDGEHVVDLAAGDFFGEISLLQNDVTTADVVARDAGRCLTLTKDEFLRFIAQDVFTACSLESIGQARIEELEKS